MVITPLAAPLSSLTAAPLPKNPPRSELWSLRPLALPAVPRVEDKFVRNPIDAFILAKLKDQGLTPSPEADRRTLIRRLYFDLIGLPPSPEEVEAFVADTDACAYERLVDQLLDSPRYGECWARHWLDVVHYGETHGYDKDKPRPHAWPYRDYVIRAFNQDKPYARFVQEQLAGDVLFPYLRDGVEALGFIAAGPWDFIGHAEVPETKIDGKVARHLDRDDMVANTMQTFTSLTVQCAQCHDHKFDPITQDDYYSLQAVFAAIDRTDKEYDQDPAVAQRRSTLRAQQKTLAAQKKELDDRILARAGEAMVALDAKIAALKGKNKREQAYGYHSNIEKQPGSPKWVQVDLGRSVPLGNVVLHPCQDDFNQIGPGFGFPVRFKVELSDEPSFMRPVTVGNRTAHDVPNPKLEAQSFEAAGRSARYIRVTATRLALRQNDYIFALAELEAIGADGRNYALNAEVSALDSIEAPERWQKKNLTDGYYPGVSAFQSAELDELIQQRQQQLDQATQPEEATRRTQLQQDLTGVESELAALPPPSVAYVGSVHHGSGAFSGTGPTGGKPRHIYVLSRGNVQKPGEEARPGALSALSALPARFAVGAEDPEGARRAALARWLTDARNPLTWRSIVNRLWQYHFGQGLVDTPNDFGHMGSPPSHPLLLDWLAATFRDGGQSIKQLHRLIVTSSTYRQSSADNPASELVDSDNRSLWRMNRRKLEAEAVRDSVLALAGQLDLKMGGPSFMDFVIDKPEHSPHYEYGLHNPEDPQSHRRTIYRFIVRSQPAPFMAALDCADPSMQVGRRNESVSPPQALAMLNDALILAMAKSFAARLNRGVGELPEHVARGYYEAIGRPPTTEEGRALAGYAKQFGLANACRVLFNLNGFVFVD